MADIKEMYADGVEQIQFAAGMIRMDLVTLQPQEDGKEPVPEIHTRLIMPPQGFLNAFGAMQQLIDKLVADGILKKRNN